MDWTSFFLGILACWGLSVIAKSLWDNWRLRRTQTAFLRHLEANRASSNHVHFIGINEFPPQDADAIREAMKNV